MLKIIYGTCDSSKSEYLYSLAIDALASESAFLVVPEQTALGAEKRIYELAKDKYSLGLEVLNFERLAESVFRKCGFLSYNYINDSAKKLLLRKAMDDIKPALSEYSAWTADESFITNMLAQISEFKHSKVSPETLARVSESLTAESDPTNSKLIRRLDDFALIFAAYNALVSESFDDRSDDLSKCADLILAGKPFTNASFFLDDFNGFTIQQYEVISALLKTGNNVYVTLCHPGMPADEIEGSEIYAYTYETEGRLIEIAEEIGCDVEKAIIDDNVKFNSSELEFLCKNFSISGKQVFEGEKNGRVRAISCSDIFDECETCAALIAEDIRQGLRYKDISIITRDVERYKGIIDAILERHSIPVFFSSKTDITEKSLTRFIFSAFSVCFGKTDYNEIISHIRCGLSSLDEHECDLLEAYASTWKIKGKSWWDPDGFKMNPRGYIPFTNSDQALLDEINAIKLKLMSGLESFKASIRICKNVSDYSTAVYEYLKLSGVTEKLAHRSVIMKARGEDILAKEEAGLWGALCSAINVLCQTVGNLECDTDTYISLLKLVLNDTDVGTIPQTSDVVTVGDASLVRADAVKHTYLIGCSEGMFPKSVTEPALLSRKDRQSLTEHNVSGMEFDPALEASMELFWFYRAATSPSDRLTMTYSRLSESNEELFPSSAFTRISDMFGGVTINSGEIDISKRIISNASFAEYTPYLIASGYEKQVKAILEENKELKDEVYSDSTALVIDEETISKENISKIYKGDLHLSQTATDKFVGCPFAFHCKYSLKLKETSTSQLQSNDTGTLIHSILESFIKDAKADGTFGNGEFDVDKISKRIKEITERQSTLIMEFTPENKKARIAYMLKRLSEITTYTAINLVDEFSQSGFVPTFFELPIREGVPGGIMPVKLALEDGSYVILGGISDRVDTMVKGDKLYVRVADYKSSEKYFNLNSIKLGLSLQLLIYLFSIWDNADEAFKLASGAEPHFEIIPAGAEYVTAIPTKLTETKDKSKVITDLLGKSFKRSGIYLADRDIITSMDRDLSSKFVPVSKKFTDTKSCTLRSLEELNNLKDEVSGILTEIGNSIKSGRADASPLGKIPSAKRNYTECEYCEMKFICKKADHDTVVEFEEDENEQSEE